MPRDRQGSFEPRIVRQRRLGGVDEMVISLTAKGLPTGEVQAHLAEVYGADAALGHVCGRSLDFPQNSLTRASIGGEQENRVALVPTMTRTRAWTLRRVTTDVRLVVCRSRGCSSVRVRPPLAERPWRPKLRDWLRWRSIRVLSLANAQRCPLPFRSRSGHNANRNSRQPTFASRATDQHG